MQDEIAQLKKRLSVLKEKKRFLMRQRFTYPLSNETQEILKIDNVIFTGRTFPINDVTLTDFVSAGLSLKLNDKPLGIAVVCVLPLKQFTANATTNELTYANGNHYLNNDDVVYFTTSNTLPSPLSETTTYYVVQRTDTTFKVSTSVGGAEVNILDAGTGTHYYTEGTLL